MDAEIVARFQENGQDCLAVRVRETRLIDGEQQEIDVEYIGRIDLGPSWGGVSDAHRLAALMESVRAQMPQPTPEPDPMVGQKVTL